MSDNAPALEPLPTLRTLQERLEARVMTAGTLVRGRVVGIDDDVITLDVDGNRGVAPRAEFAERPTPGTEIEVYVDDADVDPPVFSVHKGARLALWRWLETLRSEGDLVSVTVIGDRGDDLSVDLGGIKASLPRRELAPGRSRGKGELIGQQIEVRITRIREKKAQILVSERAPLMADREVLKAETLSTIEPGQVIEGEVQRLTNFGAFVDIGGIDGLLHINDMSHKRLRHPSDIVDVGDVIAVKVLSYDPDKEKIGLGLRQLMPDPWLTAVERYTPGTQVRGEVVGLTKFGAFVMLSDGIEGLAHISEMAWGKQVQRPGDVVKKGQTVDAWVLRIDPEQKRMGLTLRNPAENPWFALAERMSVGTILEAPVARVADFGIFINLDAEHGLDGLVHQNDFSWGSVTKPTKSLFKPGDVVEVMVLGIEPERGRATLGIKQLHADLASELIRNYSVGQTVEGRVTSLMDFGAFVEIEPGLEGLLHVGEIADGHVEHPADVLEAGQPITVTITRIDQAERKIALTRVQPSAEDAPAEAPAAEAAPEPEAAPEAPAAAVEAAPEPEATAVEAAPEPEPVEAAPEPEAVEAAPEPEAVEAAPEPEAVEAAPEPGDADEVRETAPYGVPVSDAPPPVVAAAPEPVEKGNTDTFPVATDGEGEGV